MFLNEVPQCSREIKKSGNIILLNNKFVVRKVETINIKNIIKKLVEKTLKPQLIKITFINLHSNINLLELSLGTTNLTMQTTQLK